MLVNNLTLLLAVPYMLTTDRGKGDSGVQSLDRLHLWGIKADTEVDLITSS
jgi:hypothetical protein